MPGSFQTRGTTVAEAGRGLYSHGAESLVGEMDKKEVKYTQSQVVVCTVEKNKVRKNV